MFTDKAGAVVEPPPDVVLSVLDRFGTTHDLTITLGKSAELHTLAGKDCTITVAEVIRKKIRPSSRPPYKFLITATDGSFRVVRSMDETNAERLFHNSNDEPKEVESVEVVIPGV